MRQIQKEFVRYDFDEPAITFKYSIIEVNSTAEQWHSSVVSFRKISQNVPQRNSRYMASQYNSTSQRTGI